MTSRDGLPPVPATGWLPRAADALFGEGAEAEEAYGLLTVDVPAGHWVAALTVARDELGCTYFDWLSAVDEPGLGFRVCAHLVALPTESAGVRRLVVRTTVPHEAAVLPTATGVYAGAAWHERETHEMFGLDFTGHPGLDPLLLPDGFEGHPLRKDFVLAARVVKAWPGAKEPGESGHGGGRRRQMLPPGVPDPNEWGPQAGRAPAADQPPARPRRARSASAGSASQRPDAAEASGTEPSAAPRRARSASGGSASQRAEGASGAEGAETATPPNAASPARPRRSRSASGGSASQRAEGAEAPAPPPEPGPARPRRARSAGGGSASQRGDTAPGSGADSPAAPSSDSRPSRPRRARSAGEGSASQRAGDAAEPAQGASGGEGTEAPAPPSEAAGPSRPRRSRSAGEGSASRRGEGAEGRGREAGAAGSGPARAGDGEAGPRSTDAPWHHARPAFEDEEHDSGDGDDERGEV